YFVTMVIEKNATKPHLLLEAAPPSREEGLKDRSMSGAAQKLLKLSPSLSGLLGKSELTRPAAVKELYVAGASQPLDVCTSWAYVKRHELQDPQNGRLIHTNQEMKEVFRMDQIEFTQVAGLISKHLEKKP
ncbi:hypothetical protein BBJ28_00019202, partial [Nothophytophthora sp. Chile5]